MKLWRSAKLKIIAATSMVVFTLFACFAGSIAWFNTVQMAADNADNMAVARLDTCVTSITFHEQVGTYDVTDGDATNTYYLFDQTEFASIEITDNTAGAMDLNEDSYAYKDNYTADGKRTLSLYSLLSQDHPVLILFNIRSYTADDPRSIRLDFSTEADYLASAERVAAETLPTKRGNPLSSVVQFSCEALTTDLTKRADQSITVGDEARTYQTYQYGLEDGINYSKGFASFDSDGDLSGYSKSVSMFSNVDGEGNVSTTVYKQLAVVMNYNITSLEYIYNQFIGHDVLESNIFFSWDWVMEI